MSEIEQLAFTPAALVLTIKDRLEHACRETFGASLRAVILTGSVARNEASYTCKTGQVLLLSDVEAIVVLHDVSPLPSRQVNMGLCGCIEQQLAERGVLVHLSLSVVHVAYLRNLPPHIYSYELRICGLVVCGDAAILNEIPAFAAAELTMEDAWRLLSNRLIEQMEVTDRNLDANQVRYRSIKLCLDLAASLLVFAGKFEAGYCARLQRLEELTETFGVARLPYSIDEFLALVRQCTTAKLQPDTAVDLGDGFEEQIASWAWRSWIWQFERMTSCNEGTSADKMISVLGRSQDVAKLLRGWLYVVRRTGWISSIPHWPKWLASCCRNLTPRHAIYLAAYEWEHRRTDSDPSQLIKVVCDLLPVTRAAQAASSSDVSRQIFWNYHEFVTETRA
jgi:hypothetical protein